MLFDNDNKITAVNCKTEAIQQDLNKLKDWQNANKIVTNMTAHELKSQHVLSDLSLSKITQKCNTIKDSYLVQNSERENIFYDLYSEKKTTILGCMLQRHQFCILNLIQKFEPSNASSFRDNAIFYFCFQFEDSWRYIKSEHFLLSSYKSSQNLSLNKKDSRFVSWTIHWCIEWM